MLQLAVRAAPRPILASRLPFKSYSQRRFLSAAPSSQRSRSWKSSAARWALAIGGIYYYNTSSVFAEQPDEAITRLDQSIHHVQESNLPTLETLAGEKRQRQAEQQARERQAVASAIQHIEEESEGSDSIEGLEEEADQQGAFNPETGEINWDCPCLGGMAHGPCGEDFKAAFSCFVYSKEEPKGMECIDKFKSMQDCFRQHPEMYGSELEDDEDEVEEELRAEASARRSENVSEQASSIPGGPEPAGDATQTSKELVRAKPSPTDQIKPVAAVDEGGELVLKAAHDETSQ